MMTTKLSKRLSAIASLVPRGDVVADIGSDHALLPVYLVNQGISPQVIAGELNAGPYEAATSQVKAAGLDDRIDVRRGNGLTVLEPGEADTITIAGMGGSLIVDILKQGLDRLTGVRSLILQPNVAEDAVRRWLAEHDYMLLDEQILMEDGFTYTILYAEHVQMKLLEHDVDQEQYEEHDVGQEKFGEHDVAEEQYTEHDMAEERYEEFRKTAKSNDTINTKHVDVMTVDQVKHTPSSLYSPRQLSCGLEVDAAMLFRFGPYLIERMEPAFVIKWQEELAKLIRIRQQITAKAGSDEAAERLRELDRDIAEIEEVLECSRQVLK